jgi:hypothetical protein
MKFSLLLLLWLSSGADQSPSIHPEAMEHQVRTSVLSVRWKLMALTWIPSREDPKTLLLEINPPPAWSVHSLPYRFGLSVVFNSNQGKPGLKLSRTIKKLSKGVRRLIVAAEKNNSVRHFLERYPVVQARIERSGGNGRFRAILEAAAIDQKRPAIAFDENVRTRISLYRVPGIDGLPVRRELLRMVEVLSREHPKCRPVWVEARLHPGEGFYWGFHLRLEGDKCPDPWSVELNQDGSERVPSL